MKREKKGQGRKKWLRDRQESQAWKKRWAQGNEMLKEGGDQYCGLHHPSKGLPAALPEAERNRWKSLQVTQLLVRSPGPFFRPRVRRKSGRAPDPYLHFKTSLPREVSLEQRGLQLKRKFERHWSSPTTSTYRGGNSGPGDEVIFLKLLSKKVAKMVSKFRPSPNPSAWGSL